MLEILEVEDGPQVPDSIGIKSDWLYWFPQVFVELNFFSVERTTLIDLWLYLSLLDSKLLTTNFERFLLALCVDLQKSRDSDFIFQLKNTICCFFHSLLGILSCIIYELECHTIWKSKASDFLSIIGQKEVLSGHLQS